MVGYTATLFISLLSKEGCKLLYPIKTTTFTGPKNYLENNSKKDYAATTFLIVLMVITLVFSTSGLEIIEDINENTDITRYLNHNSTELNKTINNQHYINIDAENCRNMNITTKTENNTTTTIIKDYVN